MGPSLSGKNIQSRSAVFCFAILLFLTGSAPDAGANWDPLGSGLNGPVYALAVDNYGYLYAAGDFTLADQKSANHIARWDGSTWTALGTGLNGPVYALAVDRANNLYAAGDFTTAGNLTASNVAQWNGSHWAALGTGLNNIAYALAVDSQNRLYAGGDFITAGSVTANRVALWNGSTWSPLGSGADHTVFALAVDGQNNLYAGGAFSAAGSTAAHYVARWNGSAWSELGKGLGNFVYALAVDTQNRLYAGGLFTTAGGAAANRIARWNGSTWSALGSGMNNAVRALTVDDQGILYAGGDFITAGGLSAFFIAQYSLSSWSALNSGMNNSVSALMVNAQRCLYAGGDFIQAGGSVALRAARWPDRCQTVSGTVRINDGAVYANAASVLLSLSGNQIARMQFSNDGVTWSPWESFAPTKAWFLSAGSGTRTVFARFADSQGLVSSPVSDTIILDTLSPESSSVSPPVTCNRSYIVSWSGHDDFSGVAFYDLEYRVGVSGSWKSWLSGVSTLSASFGPSNPVLVQPGFTYYFQVRAADQAGNLEAFPGGDGNTQTRVLDCPFDTYFPVISR
jgi:hypothetical protein